MVDADRANADARLAFGVATACGVALCTFVVWPQYVENMLPPVGAGDLVPLGFVFSVLLGPVAVGLSGYASFATLWRNGSALPASARRLHLVTVLVAPLLLVLFLTVGSEALSSWAD